MLLSEVGLYVLALEISGLTWLGQCNVSRSTICHFLTEALKSLCDFPCLFSLTMNECTQREAGHWNKDAIEQNEVDMIKHVVRVKNKHLLI